MDKPLLSYPFADSISPHAPQLEALTQKWLQENYPLLPPQIRDKYIYTCTGYLTARFFPLASYERLVTLSMSSLWGLAFDDYYEHGDAEGFRKLRTHIGAIIRGAIPLDLENDFFHQMKAMADGFRQYMPPYWMDRFARSMEAYINGMAGEALYKAALQFPSQETYMGIRWRSVDVLQMVDGLEVATGIPLPDKVRDHPHLEKMVWLTCRIIAWCNDYFSADKEQGRDVMNLVLLLQHQNDSSLEAAKAAAVRIHDHDLKAYLSLASRLPDFGAHNRAVEQIYIV